MLKRTLRRSAAVPAVAVLLALAGCGADLVAVPVPDRGSAALCRALHRALPDRLGDLDRRDTDPASARTAAWGDPPVTLRCGVAAPRGAGSDDANPLAVDGVAWLEHIGGDRVQWTTFRRRVYVELSIPKSRTAASYLVALAGPVRRTVPAAGG